MRTHLILSISAALLAATSAPYAQLGSRPADDWIARLERPERVAGLKTAEVIEKLQLKKGDVVADLGAGAGVFAWPLARAVAPGTVFAVEVDKGYLPHLEKRAQEQRLSNVKPRLGQFEDPQLPEKVDLAFFHDVLHHIEKRDVYLAKVASYLKPGGRIAVIELDADRPDASHRDDPSLQVRRPQVEQWMTAAGLQKETEVTGVFEDKWFVIYRLKK